MSTMSLDRFDQIWSRCERAGELAIEHAKNALVLAEAGDIASSRISSQKSKRLARIRDKNFRLLASNDAALRRKA